MPKKKYPPTPAGTDPSEFDFGNRMHISSSGDCTGLIPSNPDAQEYENYTGLYDFLPDEYVIRSKHDNEANL